MVTVNDVAAWRERVFSSLLEVVLIGGAASALLVTPFLLQQGIWPVAVPTRPAHGR